MERVDGEFSGLSGPPLSSVSPGSEFLESGPYRGDNSTRQYQKLTQKLESDGLYNYYFDGL